MFRPIDQASSQRLEVLRGASALVVLLAHLQQIFLLPQLGLDHPLRWLGSGAAAYAVMSFFVLSGFLITTSILRNHQQNGGQFKPELFLRARVRRIYPPLFASLLLCLLIYSFVTGFSLHGSEAFAMEGDLYTVRERVSFDWRNWLSNAFLLQGVAWGHPLSLNGPLWSISYEWWYYLLAMLVFMGVLNRQVVLGIVPAALVIAMLYMRGRYEFLLLAVVWIEGVLLALAYHQNRLTSVRAKLFIYGQALLAAALAAYWVSRHGAEVMLPSDHFNSRAFLVLSSIVLLVLFVPLLRQGADPLKGSISRFFCDSARYSYSLYVLHFPILILFFCLLHPVLHASNRIVLSLVMAVVGLLTTFICARVARFVEPST